MQWIQNSDNVERLFHVDLFGNENFYDVAVYTSNKSVVIECEASELNQHHAMPLARITLKKVKADEERSEYLHNAADAIRDLTGFDRVMVYQFHHDDSGEVMAESLNEGADSFMGLRFPASDIPKQARELYLRSVLRIIADVDAQPVNIYPARSIDGQILDLSLSMVRSVSPMHIEYLKNMGIKASISIIIDGKLWCLFACHHMSPR